MSILSVVVHVLCVYASKLLSGFFGTRYGFFGEDRLATLLCSLADSILQSGVCGTASPAAHLCSTVHIGQDISAASFCSCKLL